MSHSHTRTSPNVASKKPMKKEIGIKSLMESLGTVGGLLDRFEYGMSIAGWGGVVAQPDINATLLRIKAA